MSRVYAFRAVCRMAGGLSTDVWYRIVLHAAKGLESLGADRIAQLVIDGVP